MEEPSATPMERSILFFIATKQAVMCSHAFPAMGRTMSPRKRWFRPEALLTSSSAPVKNLHESQPT